jgi:hypothetical protein
MPTPIFSFDKALGVFVTAKVGLAARRVGIAHQRFRWTMPTLRLREPDTLREELVEQDGLNLYIEQGLSWPVVGHKPDPIDQLREKTRQER